MGYPARQLMEGANGLETALVCREDSTGLFVRQGDAVLHVSVAVSCLTAPQPGDEVLLSSLPDGRIFVLAVLTRPTHAPALLRFAEGVSVESRAGITLTAAAGIDLIAPETTLTTARLDVDAAEASCRCVSLRMLGRKILTFGQLLERSFEKIISRCSSSTTFVTEHEEVQAGSRHVAVQGSCITHAEHVAVAADKSVKVDGEHIFLA